jgi:hypothetical protein
MDIRTVHRCQDNIRLLGQRICIAHGSREPNWDVAAPVDADPCWSRYRKGMPRIVVSVVTIRTTSDSPWRAEPKWPAQGIVTGMGLSPELALKELEQQTQTRAEKVAEPYNTPDSPPIIKEFRRQGRLPEDPADVPKQWRFEVVDVRLAPAVIEGKNGWLAYGTLLSEDWRPRQVR